MSLIIRRQTATSCNLGLCDQLIRALRIGDTELFILQLHENGKLCVVPRIQKSDTNFKSALEPGLELTRTPRAKQKRDRSAKNDYA